MQDIAGLCKDNMQKAEMKGNKKTMKKIFLLAAAMIAAGISSACIESANITYKPAEQKMPAHIRRVAVRPFTNKTPQFGLEEKVTLKVAEEFLKNGEYTVSAENNADGIIIGEIANYILTPIQYDVNMVANVYKMNVIASVRFLDRAANRYLWEEPALQATKIFSAAALPGGMTEEAAREELWEILAKNITLRTVEGFGSVSSISQKKLPPAHSYGNNAENNAGTQPITAIGTDLPETDNAGLKELDR